MQKKLKIQVQSVLYNNEKVSVCRAMDAMANAVRVYCKQFGADSLELSYIYGDSSTTPTFTEKEIAQINKKHPANVKFAYRFFGFNSGSAKGHNILSMGFRGDYYIIMNPDVKVAPHFLIDILQPFEDKQVGLVEARQTPLEHTKVYDPKTLETEWSTTACVAIRKKAFADVHGFDSDTFFLYCDDLDFSWRLRLNGWKLIYQPLAVVYHAKKLGCDAKWLPTKAEVYYSALAQMLMAYKWSNPERVEVLKTYFMQAGGDLTRAAQEYERLRKSGKLPQRLDPKHKVARFVGDYYTENRYVY